VFARIPRRILECGCSCAPLRNHFEAKSPPSTRIPGGLELLLTRNVRSISRGISCCHRTLRKFGIGIFQRLATYPMAKRRIFLQTLSRARRKRDVCSLRATCLPTKKTDNPKRHRDYDGRVLAVNARRGFRTFALRARAIEDRHKSRASTGRRERARVSALPAHPRRLGVRAQKRKVINEPRLNVITRRGGYLLAHGDARGALCQRRAHHRYLTRYPFSPLTFNAFPKRARTPCQSQASPPQILQNTDINRLITRMALSVDI